MDIMSMTAVEIGKKIRSKEISVAEAVKASLSQIEKAEEKIHSFVTVDREGALKRAEKIQKQLEEGSLTGPLAGVFVPRICLPPAVLRFWKTLSPHLQQRQ